MKTNKWIQKAKIRKGTLSKQLGIPISENIPMDVLEKVQMKKIGNKIRIKGKDVPITLLLKRRANLAINLKRIRE